MAYFVRLPNDEQQYLDPEFQGGIDSKFDMHVPQGHLVRGMDLQACLQYHIRVPPELLGAVPTRIILVTPDKQGYLPDFGLAPWGGWKLVSQAFVDIVERLEPGRHEFLPIADTVDQKGISISKRFFLMNILQQFNAVDVERSNVQFHAHHYSIVVDGKRKQLTARTMRLVKPHRLALKSALVAGHHLWHGTTEDIYFVFFSDELHDVVQAAGLSPLRYARAEEL